MITDTLLKIFRIDKLAESLTGYVESKIELFKYQVKEDIAESISRVVVFAVFFLIANMVLLFISLAVALHLSGQLGPFAGFAIVAGVYLLLLIVLIIFRTQVSKQLERQFMDSINKKDNGHA